MCSSGRSSRTAPSPAGTRPSSCATGTSRRSTSCRSSRSPQRPSASSTKPPPRSPRSPRCCAGSYLLRERNSAKKLWRGYGLSELPSAIRMRSTVASGSERASSSEPSPASCARSGPRRHGRRRGGTRPRAPRSSRPERGARRGCRRPAGRWNVTTFPSAFATSSRRSMASCSRRNSARAGAVASPSRYRIASSGIVSSIARRRMWKSIA